jgi:hypothetical protein
MEGRKNTQSTYGMCFLLEDRSYSTRTATVALGVPLLTVRATRGGWGPSQRSNMSIVNRKELYPYTRKDIPIPTALELGNKHASQSD